ncbi:LPS export ABC transporter permease LptG [Pseudohongiella sp.]|uniref:LPS export ABC transporter permease LptG n=1 Tax=marine sediment metagenome TaxID=412755 RepID=A0A0F9Z6E8_9ZZZZ|nr:LPS export ABC transporter permease LptG [Pseudohongiella sp.]HDZ09517.1 LPS export ABC transporter permease LptG [Pseudohongiella sp.]HEA62183.1 LPS export ABC transporter permease LptG [Pseudohongiella sp.]
MPMLARYMAKTVLLSMLVVLGLITMIDLVFTVAEELADTNRYYTAWDAIVYVLRTLPTSVYELLPFVALGGALIGLGILASSQELLVMQSSGVKTSVLVGWVMIPVLGVMVFSLILGEWIAPTLQQTAQSQRALIQSGGQAISSSQGDWRKIGNEYIHINAIAPGGRELFGVTVYELSDRRELLRSSFAEQGYYMDDDGEPYWRLTGVRETRFAGDRLQAEYHDEWQWSVDMSPSLLSVLLVRPDRQSISGLYQFARYFDTEGLDSSNYYLAFWKKLLQPLATLSLVLLAVSFVFGPLREATMGFRVFVAIAIGLGFTIVQRTLGPATILYGISPFVAVLAPIMLCALLGLFLLRRV